MTNDRDPGPKPTPPPPPPCPPKWARDALAKDERLSRAEFYALMFNRGAMDPAVIARLERDYPDTPRIGDPRKVLVLPQGMNYRLSAPAAEAVAFAFGLGVVLGLAILRNLL